MKCYLGRNSVQCVQNSQFKNCARSPVTDFSSQFQHLSVTQFCQTACFLEDESVVHQFAEKNCEHLRTSFARDIFVTSGQPPSSVTSRLFLRQRSLTATMWVT